MIADFRRVTAFAQILVAEILSPGDTAIDATMGTGEDTLFLAAEIGIEGKVYAFDVNPAALVETKEKLTARGCQGQVELRLAGHETLGEIPELATAPKIKAVMFNLGYLPGGDGGLLTQAETTVTALGSAATLLAAGGIITICLYRHPGSEAEIAAVENWAAGLGKNYLAHRVETINRSNPPYLIWIYKAK